jgi:hypothetical protein
MRIGLCLAAAGLLLSGCASVWPTTGNEVPGRGLAARTGNEVPARGLAAREVTSATAPPATERPAAPWYARSNGNCATWDQDAYHYECDPNANY